MSEPIPWVTFTLKMPKELLSLLHARAREESRATGERITAAAVARRTIRAFFVPQEGTERSATGEDANHAG